MPTHNQSTIYLLPEAGPTRLPRQVAAEAQRRRLLRGMAQCLAAKGYAETSIGDITAAARVSRRTFYEQFSDKQAAFLALIETGSQAMTQAIVASQAQAQTPLERVDQLIGVYLQRLSDDPDFARAYLVETFAAGGPAIQKRRESMDKFIAIFRDLYASTKSRGAAKQADEPDFELLVAAISSAVTMRVATGEAAKLPELRPRLLRLIATTLEMTNAAPAQKTLRQTAAAASRQSKIRH